MTFLKLILCLSVFSLFASEQVLVKVTNNTKKDGKKDLYYVLSVITNEAGEAVQLKKQVYSIKTNNVVETKLFNEELIHSRLVIEHIDDIKSFDVVYLSSSNFTPVYGGDVTINFLSNGVTNDRKTTGVKFQNDKGNWSVVDSGGRKINELKVVVNKAFPFGEVGIKEIQFGY